MKHRTSAYLAAALAKDINTSGRYQAVRPGVRVMDRGTGAGDIRRLRANPDVAVGSVAAVTETDSLVAASASGSQLPSCAGGTVLLLREAIGF
jgi:hypothetical protein